MKVLYGVVFGLVGIMPVLGYDSGVVGRIDTHITALQSIIGQRHAAGLVDERILNHALVHTCAKRIVDEHSLRPLQQMWAWYNQYGVRQEELFLRETSLLILSVYIEFAVRHRDGLLDKVHGLIITFGDVASLYYQASQLPVGELLDVVDRFASHVKELVNPYIYNNLTWTERAHKYWWVPVVIGIALYVKTHDIKVERLF